MFLTILAAVLTVSSAALLGAYGPPPPQPPISSFNPSQIVGSQNEDQTVSQGFGNIEISNRNEAGGIGLIQDKSTGCGLGEVQGLDGGCQQAEVSRKLFLVEAPQLQSRDDSLQTDLPKPKLHYNIVFVKTPERPNSKDAFLIPPPQQKTVVYVLNKGKQEEEQKIIQMQTPNHQPEVFFVNYNEGENPQLPFGIDLETALASVQSLEGQVIDGGNAGISNFGPSDEASQGGLEGSVVGVTQGGQSGFIDDGGILGAQGGIIDDAGVQGGFIDGRTQGGQVEFIDDGGVQGSFIDGWTQGGLGGFVAGGTQGGQVEFIDDGGIQGSRGGFIVTDGVQGGQGEFITDGTQGGQGRFIAGRIQGGQRGFIAAW